MSYILDALKKSQQERELGYVPTLESPTFLAEEENARPNLLIVLAVVLAALAVVIALYSVLRVGPTASKPVASVAQTAQMTEPEQANQEPGNPAPPPTGPVPAEPAAAAPDQQPQASSPQVREQVEPETADPSVVMEAPAAPEQPSPQPVRETPVAPKPPAAKEREQQSKVPPDLIADIEAFKQEVRGKEPGATDAASEEKKIAPQDLRLPEDVRNRLPEFVMSAHIYDTEPSRRFVLINGLKTREGEESREEITVEQILPNGAVLSFEGNRFFQRR